MTYLFTHEDLDGVGCAVIAHLAFPSDLSVKYCSYRSINDDINAFLDTTPENAHILISDISVDEETATRLDSWNVRMYDHHPIKVLRPWMTVDTAGNECGTSLLAAALLPDMSPAVAEFVEAVRLFDTWQFEKGVMSLSERLNELHNLLGHRGFVEMVVPALSEGDPFIIPHFFELAISNSFADRDRYFEKKEKAMITTTFEGYKTGLVFADRDISLMAEYVFQKHPELEIVAVCYMPAGISLRTRRDDINLTEICRQRGGGGHQKASAFYLPAEVAGPAVDIILK